MRPSGPACGGGACGGTCWMYGAGSSSIGACAAAGRAAAATPASIVSQEIAVTILMGASPSRLFDASTLSSILPLHRSGARGPEGRARESRTPPVTFSVLSCQHDGAMQIATQKAVTIEYT